MSIFPDFYIKRLTGDSAGVFDLRYVVYWKDFANGLAKVVYANYSYRRAKAEALYLQDNNVNLDYLRRYHNDYMRSFNYPEFFKVKL